MVVKRCKKHAINYKTSSIDLKESSVSKTERKKIFSEQHEGGSKYLPRFWMPEEAIKNEIFYIKPTSFV